MEYKNLIDGADSIESNYEYFKNMFNKANIKKPLVVQGIPTIEFENVRLKYKYTPDEIFNKAKSLFSITDKNPHKVESIERRKVCELIKQKSYIFSNDIFSRQFVIQKNHVDKMFKESIPSNMSCLQFVIREYEESRTLNCYVTFRSQDIDNFLFDNLSVLIYCQMLIDKFSCKTINIDFNIISLYKVLNK